MNFPAPEPKSRRKVVLFEPYLRGSRLQIAVYAARAVQESGDCDVEIVTRSDFDTPHVRELFKSQALSCKVVVANTDLDGSWIAIMRRRQFSKFVEQLRYSYGDQDVILVFMALDDYLVGMLSQIYKLRNGRWKFVLIKYRVEYLLANRRRTFRGRVLNVMTRIVVAVTGGHLVGFDERLAGAQVGGSPFLPLPDPWVGEFTAQRRHLARRSHHFNEDSFVMLSVGRQDKRKGIDVIIAAARTLLLDNSHKLMVVGGVAAEYSDALSSLCKDFPGQVVHVDRFVDETDLPDYFAVADVFLMPYSIGFTSSSGTLPRAAATAVPIVASDHGLVGHRVRSHGLGETFPAGHVDQFVAAVNKVRAYRPERLLEVQKGAELFAKSSCQQEFSRGFRSIICGSARQP